LNKGTCLSSFSGNHLSSQSRKAISSPFALLIALFLASPRGTVLLPPNDSNRKSYDFAISKLLSVEALSQNIISQFVYVCSYIELIASGRYFSPL